VPEGLGTFRDGGLGKRRGSRHGCTVALLCDTNTVSEGDDTWLRPWLGAHLVSISKRDRMHKWMRYPSYTLYHLSSVPAQPNRSVAEWAESDGL